MVSLKQLEQAVAAVEDINRQTIEFEIEGTTFVLRSIRPSEDMEVLTFVRESLESILQRDWLAIKHYSFQQRLAVLSFVIIRMGDLDLSGDYLDTGETTETGVPIQTPKAQALREHMSLKWSAALLEAVFAKYTELVMQLNERVLLKIDNEKIGDQISRLREQLSTLERLQPPAMTPDDILQSLLANKHERRAEKEVLMPEVKIPDSPEVESQKPLPKAPSPKPSVPPPSFAAPEPEPEPEPTPRAPIYPKEVFDPRDPVQRGRMAQVADPFRGDSFMDSSDPEQAIAAENARQEAFYRAQQEAKAQELKARRSTRPQMRDSPSAPEVPTFRVPAETLDVSQEPPEVNAAPRTNNPRFMPRR